MKKSVALPCVLITLASIIAGCGAAGNVATSATPTPAPSPTATCTPPPGYSIQEVFPQQNGQGVANLQGVAFAIGPSPLPANASAPSPLPTNWYIYAVSTYGTTYGTTSIAFLATPVPVPGSTAGSTPTPLPTPSDTPSPGFLVNNNYIYETASLGTFANSTQFTIYLANTNCYNGLQESTFTTNVIDQPSATPSPSST